MALASRASAYTNDGFGFSLETPPGLTVCGEQPPAPNNGVSVLLHGHDCNQAASVSRVNVWGEFNVAYEAGKAADVLKALCPSMDRVSMVVAGKTFSGCPTHTGPNPAVFFVFLRLSPDRPVYDGVIYSVQLTIAHDTKAADAATFRDILKASVLAR